MDCPFFIIGIRKKLLLSEEKERQRRDRLQTGRQPPVANYIKPKRRRCDREKYIKLCIN